VREHGDKIMETSKVEVKEREEAVFTVKPVETQDAPLLEQGCIR
jgi:hypothetical protein